MSFPNDYTYNFCPNPNFVAGISGTAGVAGAVASQETNLGWNARTSLRVQTPGNATGEGVMLPPGSVLGTVTGAVSFQIQGGPAELSVTVVDATTSAVLGTSSVILDGILPWQYVSVTSLSLVSGHAITVYIETASPVVSTFWVGAVQYEPSTTANGGVLPTPYVDGDQPQGFWTGTPEASPSYQPYEFTLGGQGLVHAPGIAGFLSSGQVVHLVNLDPALGPVTATGGVDCSGNSFYGIQTNTPGVPGGVPYLIEGGGTVTTSALAVISLMSGLTDFAQYTTSDIDPAMIKIEYSNAGTSMGNTSAPGWQRIYGTYSVPKRQAASNGWYTWNSGTFMSLGFQFGSIASQSAVNVGLAQAEPAVVTSPGPSPYQRPRALVPVIGPTAFNYCPNPAFENDTLSWSAMPSSTIARSTSEAPPGTSASLQVSGSTSYLGAWFTASDLVVGQDYVVSGYVWAQASEGMTGQLHDIQVVTQPTGSYSYQELGSCLTGTVAASVPLTSWNGSVQQWYRPAVPFTATASNMNIGFWGIPVTGASGSMTFFLSGVMISLGGNVIGYADGNTDGWGWEQGATPGDGRSYYYDRVTIASQYVEDILTQHVPLGQYSYQPVYFEPVRGYTS